MKPAVRRRLRRLHTSLVVRGVAAALTTGSALGLLACGPGVATPIPEPPTLQLGRIGLPKMESAAEPTAAGGRHIYGAPGAAPFNAVVRVTNLERTDPPAVASALGDGSFDLTLTVLGGEELRFDWQRDGVRGAPEDALFVADGDKAFHLVPSARFACIQLDPGFELDFSVVDTRLLTVHNGCTSDAVLATPRERVGATDFSFQTTLPITMGAGQSSDLSALFVRSQPSAREDTLFFDVTVGAQTVRYPVTAFAPASP